MICLFMEKYDIKLSTYAHLTNTVSEKLNFANVLLAMPARGALPMNTPLRGSWNTLSRSWHMSLPTA